MRIALINLPWSVNGRKGVRAGSRWPFTSMPGPDGRLEYVPFPFFLAYTAALLEEHGVSCRLYDAIAEDWSEEETLTRVCSYDPQLAVIETSAPSLANDARITSDLRARLPSCRIAFCGPHATAAGGNLLAQFSFLDYVLSGEYEFTVLGLAGGVSDRGVLRGRIPDLDALPWPMREGLPMTRYCDGFCGLPKPNLQVMSSRGCRFRCSFCLWPQTIYERSGFRTRKVSDVIGEVTSALMSGIYGSVYFDDDLINADRAHLSGLCSGMARVGMPWGAMARPDLMDAALLDECAAGGLFAVKYGIESADPGVLERCGKNMDLERVARIIRLTRERGIRVHLTFCVGLPGETEQTCEKTLNFIEETSPDSLQVSFAVPFPGTELYRQAKTGQTLTTHDLSLYDGNVSLVTGNGLTGEQAERLRALMTYAQTRK